MLIFWLPFLGDAFLRTLLGVLDLAAFLGFFANMLSAQEFRVEIGMRGKILFWFCLDPGSYCVMGCNSDGCNFNAGWAIS